MAMKLAFVMCLVFGLSQAQDYMCNPNNCATYMDRGIKLGCDYFCSLDSNMDNVLDRPEFDAAFLGCTMNDPLGTCAEADFVTLMTGTIAICPTEASGLYVDWAGQAPSSNQLTMDDVTVLWDACLTAQNHAAPCMARGFQPVWVQSWGNVVEDTSCLP